MQMMTGCEDSGKLEPFRLLNIDCNRLMTINFTLLSLSLASWAASLSLSKLDIGDYGLLNSLNPLFYVSLFFLSLAFAISIMSNLEDRRMYFLMLLFLSFFLFATPFLIENTARHYTGWARWGMVDYIIRNGALNVGEVWYHKWPGFFTFGAAFSMMTGIGRDNLLMLYPLLSTFIFMAFAYLVLRHLLGDGPGLWLGVWLSVTMNWVNQEFFGPQSLSLILYLLLFYFMLRVTPSDLKTLDKKEVIVASAVFLFTLAFHVLTPFFFILNFAVMSLMFRGNRLGKRERNMVLVLLVCAVVLALVLFHDLVTKFISNISIDLLVSNIVEFRLLGGNAAHTVIVIIEIITGVALALLLAYGIYSYMRKNSIRFDSAFLAKVRGHTPLMMFGVILSNAPFLLYHYGGENIMRFYLYSLVPLACILAHCAGHSKKLLVILLAFAVVAPALHVINHYANERMDYVSEAELRGADFFFDHISGYSVVINPSGHTLAESRDLENVHVIYMPHLEDWEDIGNQTFLVNEHYVWICKGDLNTFTHVYDKEAAYFSIKYTMEQSEAYCKIFDSADFCLFKGG